MLTPTEFVFVGAISVRPKIYYNQKNWELEFMNTFMTEIAVQMNNLPLLS